MSGIVYGCITPHPPVMLPKIGRGRESQVSDSIDAMGRVARDLEEARPDTVLIVSPHGSTCAEAMGVVASPSCRGSMDRWGAPGVDYRFDNDLELVGALREEARAADVPLKPIEEPEYDLDHGVMVPACFLIDQLRTRPLVPLLFSALPLEAHLAFGRAIARAARQSNRRVALIASGDLSHRLLPEAPAGYDPIGHEFDGRVRDAVASLDSQALLDMDPVLIARAGECGLRSIVILMGALEGAQVRPQVLAYEGPFGVGYLTASFPLWERPCEPQTRLQVSLAREAVEEYVQYGSAKESPEGLSEEMRKRAGVFVSIKRSGELRGCVGTTEPMKSNLAEEVIASALGAATRDLRFPPISPHELPDLEYSVYVLSPLEPVPDIAQLEPRAFGLVVRSGSRAGLLLPGLEPVKTPEQQIEMCRAKAGLGPEDPIQMFRFRVQVDQDISPDPR
ncbi:MAG: AmmeMemoRadiSam system protein A [Dehalococcoidia bacterium]